MQELIPLIRWTSADKGPVPSYHAASLQSALPPSLPPHMTWLASPVYSKYGSSSRKNPPGKDAILLSNVRTLTPRVNRLTTGRHVSPIPQLTCTAPFKQVCKLYTIETMRCKNEGYDYDQEDAQWTCETQLPPEFKLGSTDVVYEGYRNSDDKRVLRGSCSVEYRMLLTEQGKERFGYTQPTVIVIYTWFEKVFHLFSFSAFCSR